MARGTIQTYLYAFKLQPLSNKSTKKTLLGLKIASRYKVAAWVQKMRAYWKTFRLTNLIQPGGMLSFLLG